MSAPARCCPVVELRQYTLHPGRREDLIELFERELLEPQEKAGMRVLGQFRDLDAGDRFVWLRGFSGMEARAKALAAFYGGPVWARHRDAANATMVDSDDVLLLRPIREEAGFRCRGRRPPAGATGSTGAVFTATIYPLRAPADAGLLDYFARVVEPELSRTGAPAEALFSTEPSPNNFPRLPVREGDWVLVHFARFGSRAGHARHVEALAESGSWGREILPALRRTLRAEPQTLRLLPTARSLLR